MPQGEFAILLFLYDFLEMWESVVKDISYKNCAWKLGLVAKPRIFHDYECRKLPTFHE